jgi:hypothetical protein
LLALNTVAIATQVALQQMNPNRNKNLRVANVASFVIVDLCKLTLNFVTSTTRFVSLESKGLLIYMLPGDRLICALVKQQPTRTIFRNWPLHITIVPWFRLDISSSQLAKQLKEHYIGSNAFQVVVLEETQLGYKKRKVVNLVANPELMKLEGQTRRLIHALKAWVVDEADNTRNGFHPHVTALKTGRVREGDSFNCDRLYIVSQHGDFKQIDSEIIL